MSYYTERHGMRIPIEKTYDIDPEKYGALLKCCEKYFDNIAWKYPDQCKDGQGYIGVDKMRLAEEMRYEIPTLYISESGEVSSPRVVYNILMDETRVDDYDPFALLYFIEFMYANVRDIQSRVYHKYFSHYHLTTANTSTVKAQFKDDINSWFVKTGLLYTLNETGQVERVVNNDVATNDVANTVLSIKEKGTRELLQEAIDLHRSHAPNASRDAVEKLWDAFERLKTYYTSYDKSKSANKIIYDMADGANDYINLFDEEFKKLTRIGNDYRIRHHETNKIEITDDRYYDYFFNRCLSLIALAIHYLE